MFQQMVSPSRPNEWDIEDALHDLEHLQESQQTALLESIPAVWPVSHSLCFSFLKEGASKPKEHVVNGSLAEWLRQILGNYEEGGLVKARRYMSGSSPLHLGTDSGSHVIHLQDFIGRFTSFANGLTGLEFRLQPADIISTDTEVIYLPEQIGLFADDQANLLFYKMAIAIQSILVQQGSFGRQRFLLLDDILSDCGQSEPDNAVFFSAFGNSKAAKVAYQLLELAEAMEERRKRFS